MNCCVGVGTGKTEGESADFDTFFGGIVVNSVKL